MAFAALSSLQAEQMCSWVRRQWQHSLLLWDGCTAIPKITCSVHCLTSLRASRDLRADPPALTPPGCRDQFHSIQGSSQTQRGLQGGG